MICFAHVTNQMAQDTGDFEKGENDGASDALAVIAAVIILDIKIQQLGQGTIGKPRFIQPGPSCGLPSMPSRTL